MPGKRKLSGYSILTTVATASEAKRELERIRGRAPSGVRKSLKVHPAFGRFQIIQLRPAAGKRAQNGWFKDVFGTRTTVTHVVRPKKAARRTYAAAKPEVKQPIGFGLYEKRGAGKVLWAVYDTKAEAERNGERYLRNSGWKVVPEYENPAKKTAGSRKGSRRKGGRAKSAKVSVNGRMCKASLRRSRRNGGFDSEEAAGAMYKKFHGREAEHVTEFDVEKVERLNLAECGKLRYLKVRTETGACFQLRPKSVLVCTSPEGGQLYFVGGDQELDIDGLGLSASLPKDLLTIGQCFEIEYHTTKDFHNFDPVDYFHKFGEESGCVPELGYDVLSHMFYLSGGRYQVRREGIVD